MRGLNRLQWLAIVAGIGLVVAYILGLSWAMRAQSYATWGGLIILPILLALNLALIWFASRVERDPVMTGLLIAGLIAKSAGVLVRYVSVFFLYDRAADAVRYNDFAAEYYSLWRLGIVTWEETAGGVGTQLMELITTGLYTIVGPSPMVAFYVFGSFAFWGAYLIVRAYRTAMPHGPYRVYAGLVLLLPSLLYWPSSIGKDAYILFFVGVFAYGVARFFTGRRSGLIVAVVGALGIAVIRPHIAVLLMAAAAVAQLVRPTNKSPEAFLAKVIGTVVMVVAVLYLVQSSADFLGLSEVTAESVAERVEVAGENTDQGGSAFTPVPLGSPLGVPAAIVTVLFRPFPWEASSALVALQSLEGIVLLILTIRAWPKLRKLPRLLKQNSYLVFSVVYSLAFIVAFSGFSNFGILARQRTLMLPFFLVLLALPSVVEAAKDRTPAAISAKPSHV